MSVYPKNHKCDVESELWMVPLKNNHLKNLQSLFSKIFSRFLKSEIISIAIRMSRHMTPVSFDIIARKVKIPDIRGWSRWIIADKTK